MSTRILTLLTLLTLSLFATATASATQWVAPADTERAANLVDADAALTAAASNKTYIVLMKGDPAIRYDGSDSGFAATAPDLSGEYDAQASHVQMYANHLMSRHDRLLAAIGATDRKLYSYAHTMNGFAAELSDREVAALRKNPDVLTVFQDYNYEINTNNTPDFLGLNDRREGLVRALGLKGEDIVIGVIDTGAVPQHPSFAETRDFNLPSFCENPNAGWKKRVCARLERLREKVVYDPPEDWNGVCQVGDGSWSEDDCNNKLIGARFYVDGFIAGSDGLDEGEFISPRDSSGHGSHTASTAGGNSVIAELNGQDVARISGMAPRARVAVYKACWLSPTATNFSCFFSDTAMATEDAVLDGVDVLNFSVGTAQTFVDQQDLAFFDATAAGVFVARSAGNDGPGFATTNAGEPWVMSVAASTADGTGFTLGLQVNAPASVAGTYPAIEGDITTPLAVTGPLTGDLVAAEPLDACGAGVTNTFDGNVALIARGGCPFDDKLTNAVAAGAAAVVVYTNDAPKVIMSGDTSNPIPGVMIDNAAGLALVAELEAGATVNVTLDADTLSTETLEGDIMADFSSRGPYLFESDFLKPDITAPGVRILAANSPDQADGSQGGLFGYLQGTSMSSPHIAGLAALLRQARPDWSPAQIKSALMTTARQDLVKEDGATPADPFDFGAGHPVPNDAVSPGLTYDVGALDYAIASCGSQAAATFPGVDFCEFVESIGLSTEPADLNLPSIAIGELSGSQTVTRTVTAVVDYQRPLPSWAWWKAPEPDTSPQRYVAHVEAPPGFNVEVTPSEITIAPGQSATYDVAVATDTAAPNTWQFGGITWKSDKGQVVRSPIALNAAAFITADEVDGTGGTGTASFDLTFGYTGAYTAGVHGMNDPGLIVATLADDQGAGFDFGTGLSSPAYALSFFDAPEATAALRFSTHAGYTAGGANDDIDLYLYYCPDFSCSLVDSSAAAGPDEVVEVQFPLPARGDGSNPYLLFVHGFDMAAADSDLVIFRHTFGVVDDAGNLNVNAPTSGTTGETVSIDIAWTGLAEGLFGKQLGAISHADSSGGVQNLTVVDVQSDAGSSICTDGRATLEFFLGRPLLGCPEPAAP